MERERRRRNGIGIGIYDEFCVDQVDSNGRQSNSSPATVPVSSTPLPSSASPSSALGYIEHPVSKFDTLAGIAIKYGVEVADVKKMNGLVTDLQMFALKTLQIPLPGRHPPSPCLSNGSNTPGHDNSDQTPPHRVQRDLFESFGSLRVKSPPQQPSPAMSSLQGYYGLKPPNRNSSSESIEMTVYRKGVANHTDDGPFSRVSNSALNNHRKSRSMISDLLDENGEMDDTMSVAEAGEGDPDKRSDNLVRRRQKSEADFLSRTPEMLLEDNSGSSGIPGITGKQLALRTKASSRPATDVETVGVNPVPVGLGDSLLADGFSGVRKSSSASSLQEQESSSSASIWSTSKWSLKPDMQAFSTAAITKPIFDGLPKPLTGRRSKAALD
ncbi:hypothetical protein UlMin_017888 [Ulmus minor]